MSRVFTWRKKRRLYKECLNHLDTYKACIVGINQERMLSRGVGSKEEADNVRAEDKGKTKPEEEFTVKI